MVFCSSQYYNFQLLIFDGSSNIPHGEAPMMFFHTILHRTRIDIHESQVSGIVRRVYLKFPFIFGMIFIFYFTHVYLNTNSNLCNLSLVSLTSIYARHLTFINNKTHLK